MQATGCIRAAVRGFRCIRCGDKFKRQDRALKHSLGVCGQPLHENGEGVGALGDADGAQVFHSQHHDDPFDSADEAYSEMGAQVEYDYDAAGSSNHEHSCSDDDTASYHSGDTAASDAASSDAELGSDSSSVSATSEASDQPRCPDAFDYSCRNNEGDDPGDRPPHLRSLHEREGATVVEGADIMYNSGAAGSLYYPFRNYTEAVCFILIHKHQLSRRAVADTMAVLSGQWNGAGNARAAPPGQAEHVSLSPCVLLYIATLHVHAYMHRRPSVPASDQPM